MSEGEAASFLGGELAAGEKDLLTDYKNNRKI
jgi:hypothetical protein